jgi:hypothetical protein
MYRTGTSAIGLFWVFTLVASIGSAEIVGNGQGSALPHKGEVINGFFAEHPAANFYYSGALIDRVYGSAFSTGNSAEASANAFLMDYSGIWGVPSDDLLAVGPFQNGEHTVPIMYNAETGLYKFTGVYYAQARSGVPVYGARLTLLVRNEPNYPLVLASSSLRDLGGFEVAAAREAAAAGDVARRAVRDIVGAKAQINDPSEVIWAGVDDVSAQPRLALKFTTHWDDPVSGALQEWLFIVDVATAEVLHQESMIYDVDVAGNVSGRATTGVGADTCGPTEITPLPHARVTNGSATVFTDALGNYVLPNAGAGSINVTASLAGKYFDLRTCNGTQVPSPQGAPCTSQAAPITQPVTPPGPANFLFNDPDVAGSAGQFKRAEVNAYLHANVVRDYLLQFNPAFPTIASEQNFPVNVNLGLNCNAFYSSAQQSINFYIQGGGCTNTGNSTVTHHEYGHRIVNAAGSGQGAYGEGFGDTMAVIVTDQSCLGSGFNAPCGTCLRNADNPCQYSSTSCTTNCGSGIHDCGRLLSGCVWSTRNALLATNPATYRQILGNLVVNSVLLHNGTTITPQITIDFLTLDDNDAEIANGTPHYNEINAGFSAHNMPAPPLAALLFTYPNGKPEFVDPSGGTTMRVHVSGNAATPQPNTGKLFVGTGGPYTEYPMTQISPNVYDAVFPALPCGSNVRFYVSAQTTTALTITSPTSAPAAFFAATSAVGVGAVAFDDNFQTDTGWTVSNSAGLTTGMWERGVPVSPPPAGAPPSDHDGSGMCYVTQNLAGNFDLDGGTSTLTSPNMDASQGPPVLRYSRWYNNSTGASPQADTMVVEISFNGGSSWSILETVGPTTGSPNPEVTGGWFQKTFSLSSVPGYVPTNQFRVRFTAGDLGSGSQVEAGIDGVKLTSLNCAEVCPADINGDDIVNVADLLVLINAWGPCALCPADITGDGNVNVADLLALINGWGDCP